MAEREEEQNTTTKQERRCSCVLWRVGAPQTATYRHRYALIELEEQNTATKQKRRCSVVRVDIERRKLPYTHTYTQTYNRHTLRQKNTYSSTKRHAKKRKQQQTSTVACQTRVAMKPVLLLRSVVNVNNQLCTQTRQTKQEIRQDTAKRCTLQQTESQTMLCLCTGLCVAAHD